MITPTLADRAWLERRYSTDRAKVADIAAEAGVDPSTVHRALQRHGIAPRGATGRRSLADVSDRAVRRELRHHHTLGEAASALSVDPVTLAERLARMGMRPWYGGVEGADEMAAEYAAGASLVAIAKSRGLSTRTVRRRLAAVGADMRPRGRPLARP